MGEKLTLSQPKKAERHVLRKKSPSELDAILIGFYDEIGATKGASGLDEKANGPENVERAKDPEPAERVEEGEVVG